jgi:tetratricopeptide (TPR) repeat protein
MKRALTVALLLAACATGHPVARVPGSEPGLAGWQALGEGRRGDAERVWTERLSRVPDDPLALFGRAAIAFEQGRSAAAAADYAAILRAPGAPDLGFGPALAAVAATRLRTLFPDLTAREQRQLLDVVRPAELARVPALPWHARFALTLLASDAARRARDADALGRDAVAAGCARQIFHVAWLGPLPNLDLDAPPPRPLPAPTTWRPLTATGCRVSLPPAAGGRGGARLARAAIEVVGGSYDVVLDYPGEARIAIDGGGPFVHGTSDRYGPRTAAARVELNKGRHQIELRIASRAGDGELALLVLPRGKDAATFVDPRGPAPAGPRPAVAMTPLPIILSPAGSDGLIAPGVVPLAAFCDALVAARAGAVDPAWTARERLRALPRFAVGLSLAGTIAREDPTVPTSFARDMARSLLRAAVAIDSGLARAWQALSVAELEDDRHREAMDAAAAAARAAPGWWAPELMRAHAHKLRGLDYDADRALEAAAAKSGLADLEASRPDGQPIATPAAAVANAPCQVLEALRRSAEERRQLARAERLARALDGCTGVEAQVDRLRLRGDTEGAIAALEVALRLDPERDDLTSDLTQLLAAAGRHGEALAALAARVAEEPWNPTRQIRLADAQAAAGQVTAARETVAEALSARPDVADVRRAARALGIALPLDGFRVDGRAAIRAFEAAGAHYQAPAVMVLDRAVTRVFPTGAVMTLTHQIVRVDTKDAIDRWGEVAVPAGAELLTVRTHKRDGSTREPEEIAGKETISAADLELGDFVEWEYLETHAPSAAFAPGFLGERFFFQSFEAPLARSELVVIAPAALTLEIDQRAGAPRAESRVAADATRVTSFTAIGAPQLFPERASVPQIEYVPSVRVSSGVDWARWAGYLAEELHEAIRSSPAVRARGAALAAAAGLDPEARAAALVAWVTDTIEGTEDFADPASFSLARGRGTRLTVALALARELGLAARPALARSVLVADAAAPTPPQELDDFDDTLLELDVAGKKRFVDLRLRHAAFGYLPPGLDGARTLEIGPAAAPFVIARSAAPEDRRTVDMTIRLDEQGGGAAVATEELAGWPALEWAELCDRFGADHARLRQDFEQRWLGVQFPGARLRDLQVDLPRAGARGQGTARVRYSFVSSHLAVPIGRTPKEALEMRIEPTFFRSQPGRRFAAEPQRVTGLMLGFDVPVRMTATVELPGSAHVDDAYLARGRDVVVSRAGGYRFVEDRELRPARAGRPSVLVLRRESALPIMRVSPADYAAVAADLRRVDGAEQEEIRIRLGSPRGTPR